MGNRRHSARTLKRMESSKSIHEIMAKSGITFTDDQMAEYIRKMASNLATSIARDATMESYMHGATLRLAGGSMNALKAYNQLCKPPSIHKEFGVRDFSDYTSLGCRLYDGERVVNLPPDGARVVVVDGIEYLVPE